MKIKALEKFKEMPLLNRVLIASGSTFSFGIILGYVLFPVILKFQVKREMSLRNKTDMKEMWVDLPFPLEFKVWVWNVTNPEEVHNGGKPIIKEVGPYFYEKWLAKENLLESKVEDSIEFNMKTTFYFNPEKSRPLTGNEIVSCPNMLLVGTANYVATKKRTALKIAAKGLNALYNNPPHVFLQHRVADLLFEGVKLDCTSKDFAPKAVCTAYKTVESIEEYEPSMFQFSVFGPGNKTNPKRFKVLRGIKNITDVGRVVQYDGKDNVGFWEGENSEHCNTFRGTDATIFRPFLTKESELWTFSPEVCRSIGTHYEKKTKYVGIKGYRYTIDLGDLPNEPENHCFCPTPDTCPPKGLLDAVDCTSAPVVLSLPHMYLVDPAVQSQIIGQNPEKDKHEIILDMEPITGTPLYVQKRLQVNIPLMNIPEIDLCAKLPNMYMPLVWFEETLALNKTYRRMLNFQLFYPAMAVSLLKWSSIFGGLGGLGYGFILWRKEQLAALGPKPSSATVAPAEDGTRSDTNSAGSQNNNGITPLDKDRPVATLQLPGGTDRY